MPGKIFGLPTHPLLVHVPVVLLPLAAIGALLIVLRPSWRERYGMLVAATAVVGTFFTIAAGSAGESLEEQLGERNALIRDHAQWGDTSRLIAVVFTAAIVGYVGLTWWASRQAVPRSVGAAAAEHAPRRAVPLLTVGLAIASIATGAAATGAIAYTGHLGAKAAWQEKSERLGSGQGSQSVEPVRANDGDRD